MLPMEEAVAFGAVVVLARVAVGRVVMFASVVRPVASTESV
jgi:hypothetical protein